MDTPPIDTEPFRRAYHPVYGWASDLHNLDLEKTHYTGKEGWTDHLVRVIPADEMTAMEFVEHARTVLTAVLPQFEEGSQEKSEAYTLIQAFVDMYAICKVQRKEMRDNGIEYKTK